MSDPTRPPRPGDLVSAEVESLPRIIRDIEAWFNDGSDNAAHPIDFICDLRDRLQGLVDYNAYRAGDAAGDPGLRAALAQLVARLDYVHQHPDYISVWTISQLHVGPYQGPTYTAELQAAKDALLARATPPPADSWQPIETAPKDGSRILVYQPPNMWRRHPASSGEREEFIQVVYWHQPGNPERNGFWTPTIRPTHWMPLPDPPLARATPRAPQQEEP